MHKAFARFQFVLKAGFHQTLKEKEEHMGEIRLLGCCHIASAKQLRDGHLEVFVK